MFRAHVLATISTLTLLQPRSPRAEVHCSLVSQAFAVACEAQFEFLAEVVPLKRGAVFMQREDPVSGDLEFFPVAVWPVAQSVFVVGQNSPAPMAAPSLPGSQDAASLLPSYPFLPALREDGFATGEIIPNGGLSLPLTYKSETLGVLAIWRDGVSQGAQAVSSRPTSDSSNRDVWSPGERKQAERVARTLAVAAKLDKAAAKSRGSDGGSVDGGGEGFERGEGGDVRGPTETLNSDAASEVATESHELLLREIRALLQSSVHQLNSPLSAVRTLSKLLLRRLDSEDSVSRELARDILIQAERLSELIQPIDRLALSLPASVSSQDSSPFTDVAASLIASPALPPQLTRGGRKKPPPIAPQAQVLESGTGWVTADRDDRVAESSISDFLDGMREVAEISATAKAQLGESIDVDELLPVLEAVGGSDTSGLGSDDAMDDGDDEDDCGLCFVSDVLQPVADLAARLAPERHVDQVLISVDGGGEGLPGVQAPPTAIREAATNLIDNALKYCQPVTTAALARDSAADELLWTADGSCLVAIGCEWDPARGKVVIEVWNSAPPADAEELRRVLGWGERGQAAAASGVSGTGYGLPIAEQLVALLGGNLELVNAQMPKWAWRRLNSAATGSGWDPPCGISARILLPRAPPRF